jgi:hypothetical protein
MEPPHLVRRAANRARQWLLCEAAAEKPFLQIQHEERESEQHRELRGVP